MPLFPPVISAAGPRGAASSRAGDGCSTPLAPIHGGESRFGTFDGLRARPRALALDHAVFALFAEITPSPELDARAFSFDQVGCVGELCQERPLPAAANAKTGRGESCCNCSTEVTTTAARRRRAQTVINT